MEKKHFMYMAIGLCLFAAGTVGGYFFGIDRSSTTLMQSLATIHPLRDKSVPYKFISPLLAYIIPSADQQPEFNSLKNTITGFIAKEKINGDISDASMFFYDLNRGRWVGVNENQNYNPASMLKVVIMVAYLKDAQNHSDLLSKQLTYTADLDELIKRDSFNSTSNLVIGKRYSISDLVNKMIIESDNGAEFLLLDNVNESSLDAIYTALGMQSPSASLGDFTISPRMYSLFFRILYSSTYLDYDTSERALQILSQATFKDGLVAGLPANVVVAHKFGEYVINSNGVQQGVELHDCGIVYYPSNPYLLCVMTSGKDEEKLKTVIKNISNLAYNDYAAIK